VEPRYDQKTFTDSEKQNRLATVVSPIGTNDGGVQLHQDAWFHLGKLDKETSLTYNLKKKGNGVYAFVLEGDVTINEIALNRRDGLGISETDTLSVKADNNTEILLMEVPMN
jgi:redox-sensitive bicupin YhaK (pirin superfamily)